MAIRPSSIALPCAAFCLAFALRWIVGGAEQAGQPDSQERDPVDSTSIAAAPETDPSGLPPPTIEFSPLTQREVFIALQNERPLALLRYLEEPRGLPEIRALATFCIEVYGFNWPQPTADLIWARWIEIDPLDAIAFATEMGERFPDYARNGLVTNAYTIWFALDPAAALASAEKSGDQGLIATLRYLRRESSMVSASEAAAEARAALGHPHREERLALLATCLADWSKTDPLGALDFARSIENPDDRRAAIRMAFFHAAKADPSHAMDILMEELPAPWRSERLIQVARIWAENDPTACLNRLMAMPEGDAKAAALGAAIFRIAESDPEAALRYWEAAHLGTSSDIQPDDKAVFAGGSAYVSKNDFRLEAGKIILSALFEKDPARALRFAASLSVPPPLGGGAPSPISSFSNVVSGALGNWAAQNADGVRRWILGKQGAQAALVSLIKGDSVWAGETAADQLAFAARLQPEAQGILGNRALARASLEELKSFAADGGLPPALSEIAARELLEARVKEEPVAVAAELPTMPAEQQNEYFRRVLFGIQAAGSAADAAAYLQGYPDQELAAAHFDAFASRWIKLEPDQAAEWIGALPDGKAREEAIAGVVDAYAPYGATSDADPAAALEWALAHRDSKRRDSSLVQVFTRWAKSDPESARTALDAAELPAETKQKLAERLAP